MPTKMVSKEFHSLTTSERIVTLAEHILSLNPSLDAIDEVIGDELNTVWYDPQVQRTWEATTLRFDMAGSLDYYMGIMDEISAEAYVPSAHDMINAEPEHTGLQEHCIQATTKMKIHMCDVGGQRSDRR